jgi:hypothetical protein
MDQNYAKLVQTFEQAGAMMGQFAYLISQYFSQLTEYGFSRQEALALCKAYQTVVIKTAFESNTPQQRQYEESGEPEE